MPHRALLKLFDNPRPQKFAASPATAAAARQCSGIGGVNAPRNILWLAQHWHARAGKKVLPSYTGTADSAFGICGGGGTGKLSAGRGSQCLHVPFWAPARLHKCGRGSICVFLSHPGSPSGVPRSPQEIKKEESSMQEELVKGPRPRGSRAVTLWCREAPNCCCCEHATTLASARLCEALLTNRPCEPRIFYIFVGCQEPYNVTRRMQASRRGPPIPLFAPQSRFENGLLERVSQSRAFTGAPSRQIE